MRKRYSIWDEMRRMQEHMDDMFDNMLSRNPILGNDLGLLEGPDKGAQSLVTSNYRNPVCDAYETDDEVVAEIELPGVDKKDIKVNVSRNAIEVKTESKAEIKHEDKKKGMYRFERSYAGFYRKFSLPDNVDPDRADAAYKDGVLKIKVPKLASEKKKAKQLEVK